MSTHLTGKNLIDLLDMLEPVPEPTPVSLWPQTPGWLVLGLILLALLVWGLRAIWMRHHARAYRRAALAELAQTGNDAARIATLLRRVALAGYPRRDVAGLTGAGWLAFLDQSYGGSGFSGPVGQVLLTAPYRQSAPDAALGDLARDWITMHRQARP
ncbi:MAG: hypothetical protein COC12_01950 [Rhodobacteraceae bacterium]|nr:MAG: hypothetical protein COC12_01950 [Paracoccaceae bacterium]